MLFLSQSLTLNTFTYIHYVHNNLKNSCKTADCNHLRDVYLGALEQRVLWTNAWLLVTWSLINLHNVHGVVVQHPHILKENPIQTRSRRWSKWNPCIHGNCWTREVVLVRVGGVNRSWRGGAYMAPGYSYYQPCSLCCRELSFMIRKECVKWKCEWVKLIHTYPADLSL